MDAHEVRVSRGGISPTGVLVIERHRRSETVERQMSCKYACDKRARNVDDFCCDECAHFGEPQHLTQYSNRQPEGAVRLSLCDGTVLVFDEFDDRRFNTLADVEGRDEDVHTG